jgi:hypothetical protein
MSDDEAEEVEYPTYGVLGAPGLRALADYLDMLLGQRAEHDGIQTVNGQLVVPTEADADGVALVAYRWGDGDGDQPRVCLFGDNDDAPDF